MFQNSGGVAPLDLQLAIECADSFSVSTGLGCMVSDVSGKILYQTGNNCTNCQLCSLVNKDYNRTESCNNAHLYGMMQAERFGGKYIYFCPAGLTCFVSPILSDSGDAALITAGPLLMVEPEDFIRYDLVDLLKVDSKDISMIEDVIAKVPYIEPEKVSKMSTLLFMAASFLSDVSMSNKMLTEQDSAEIQGQIGEFLKSIKNGEEEIPNKYPFEKERELLASIVDGDKANSQKLLNDLLGYIFFSANFDFEVIRARVFELTVLLSRSAVDGGADPDQIFGMNHQYIQEINCFTTIDELCVWLSSIMNRFTDYVFRFNDVKHIDVIRKAVDYIRRNYSKKITLDEVAAYVYLSPSYFSKVFKDEMDCNFNTYLNRIRIDRSKKLLLSDSIKLVDISGMVGFEDQSYFSKVFKKLTGVTPGKYRETRGQIRPKVSQPEPPGNLNNN